ncbi:hypothetical protein L6164_019149 [Bauhinia variegata]|uniref:Uncharacterized protein n=1 Tax=Bauhinia variegata TaxID=167791 RepID=A0ACB9NGX9_BAUVA|nr:hypothetical protein L6164_019149 [Bauhinia variegata]
MEVSELKSTSKHNQTLPPKRGQIQINILKSILQSATAFAYSCGGFGWGNGEDRGAPPSSPSPTTPTPSGYNSEKKRSQNHQMTQLLPRRSPAKRSGRRFVKAGQTEEKPLEGGRAPRTARNGRLLHGSLTLPGV